MMPKKNALVLSGGGARAAFQVGVLNAISEHYGDDKIPFEILSGTSAGGINAAFLASQADQFPNAVSRLNLMWRRLRSKQVYSSSLLNKNRVKSILNIAQMLRSKRGPLKSILSIQPLKHMLERLVDFDRIQYCLDHDSLDALIVSATNYHNHVLTSFVQSNQLVQWNKVKRKSVSCSIDVDHCLASTAIPFLFPPVQINGHFYGDGSLKNLTPIGGTIQMGATNILVITNRNEDEFKSVKDTISYGDVLSMMLNMLLNESIELDLERLDRINSLVDKNMTDTSLRVIHPLVIRPSINFSELVEHYDYELPEPLIRLFSLLGVKNNNNFIKTFLLFEQGYINALIDQGYSDAMKKINDIKQLIL